MKSKWLFAILFVIFIVSMSGLNAVQADSCNPVRSEWRDYRHCPTDCYACDATGCHWVPCPVKCHERLRR